MWTIVQSDKDDRTFMYILLNTSSAGSLRGRRWPWPTAAPSWVSLSAGTSFLSLKDSPAGESSSRHPNRASEIHMWGLAVLAWVTCGIPKSENSNNKIPSNHGWGAFWWKTEVKITCLCPFKRIFLNADVNAARILQKAVATSGM